MSCIRLYQLAGGLDGLVGMVTWRTIITAERSKFIKVKYFTSELLIKPPVDRFQAFLVTR